MDEYLIVEMDKYDLKISNKTRLLNVFRRIFMIPVLERFLVNSLLKRPSAFLLKLIPPDYLYKKNAFRSVTRNGINYKLDISHVVDHFLYFGIKDANYDPILEEIKAAKVILDIGANIGNSSLFFASINSHAQIFAYEPHPVTFKRATENIQCNSFKNIKLVNIGLGEKKGTLKLYEVNEHNPGMNRIFAEDRDMPFKEIEIDVLDNFISEKRIPKIDLIKIDVEGFEYSVLKGGRNSIIESRPILFIELDDNNLRENNESAKKLIELLLPFGYKSICRADNGQAIAVDDNFDNCHYDIIAR
jgi:FkbM family methyltransferase